MLSLAFAGCGRLGVEILSDELEEPEPELEAPDAAAVADAGVVPDIVVADDAQASVPSDAGLDARAADAAQVPMDAQVVADARVGADASPTLDASPSTDASPTLDAAPAIDAAPAMDASSDASDAAQVTPGTRIVIDYTAGSADLSDFPVRVLLDTRALIQQGQLAADCSNLRIFGDSGCGAARAYFLPAYACNSAASELWVRLPVLRAGRRETLSVAFATTGIASNGSNVFPFFDDFEGSTLDGSRWTARGQGTLTVANGVLQSQGVKQIESVASAVSAGQSIVGARLALLGAYDTDVELGVGRASGSTIWAPGRTWDGVTFVSYTVSTYAFDGPTGSACDDMANSMVPPQLSATPWADTPPASASFLTAEFAYANRSGRAEAWLRSSRGASLSYTAPANCALPTTLPVLITFDHNAPDAPTQRLDLVYVRPSAASEPSSSVQSNSSVACGSAP